MTNFEQTSHQPGLSGSQDDQAVAAAESADAERGALLPEGFIAGPYRVVRLIGQGSYAQVFQAEHVRIPTLRAAIKVLRPSHLQNAEIVARFQLEIEILGSLRTRSMPRLLDAGETSQGWPWFAMELLEGTSVDRYLATEGAMDDRDVARITRDVLGALTELHDIGVVHRDIKPANIRLTDEPGLALVTARLLDLGVAAPKDASSRGPVDPKRATVYCTPAYAAPEVLQGRSLIESDIYSLGLAMAEMLDGVPTLQDRDVATITSQQLSQDPLPFGPLTRRSPLFEVIQRACCKMPELRYRSAREMWDAVDLMLRNRLDTSPFGSQSTLVAGVLSTSSASVSSATSAGVELEGTVPVDVLAEREGLKVP